MKEQQFPMTTAEFSPSDWTPDIIRVLVVDDHRMLAEGVNAYLHATTDFEVMAVAGSGAEALERLANDEVDVVLMDYRLPDTTGDEVARTILARWPATRVLMISANDEDTIAAAAIAAGCHGLVPKGRSGAALADAIRLVHSGVAVYDPSAVVRAIPYLRRRRADRSPDWALTSREREVLACLADGASTSSIAEALKISPVTVRNHIQRILGKLDAHSRLEAVSMSIRAGILPSYPSPPDGEVAELGPQELG